jgi:hypothetical protein
MVERPIPRWMLENCAEQSAGIVLRRLGLDPDNKGEMQEFEDTLQDLLRDRRRRLAGRARWHAVLLATCTAGVGAAVTVLGNHLFGQSK